MSNTLADTASAASNTLLRLDLAVRSYPTQSRVLGFARSIIASTQLLFLLLTPSTAFLVPAGNNPAMAQCNRPFGSLSVICHMDTEIARSLLLLLLAIVASGILPRLLSWVHFYVSLAIALVIDLPEGGDYVAVTVTLWIALASLSDNRRWHWQKIPQNYEQRFRSITVPVAWSASQILKLQLVFIYLISGLGKISAEPWMEGSALYYVMRSGFVGPFGILGDFMRWATAIPAVSAAASWGTVAVEVAIAVLLLYPAKQQRLAMILAFLLHGGIIISMGLFSVSAIMIGGMLAATMPAWERLYSRPKPLSLSFSDTELEALLYSPVEIHKEEKLGVLSMGSGGGGSLVFPGLHESGYHEEANIAMSKSFDVDDRESVESLVIPKKLSPQYQVNNKYYFRALKFVPWVLLLMQALTMANAVSSRGIAAESSVTLFIGLVGLCALLTLFLLSAACHPYKRSSVLFLMIGVLGVVIQAGWNLGSPEGNFASWLWIVLSLLLAVIGLFLNAAERQQNEPDPNSELSSL